MYNIAEELNINNFNKVYLYLQYFHLNNNVACAVLSSLRQYMMHSLEMLTS